MKQMACKHVTEKRIRLAWGCILAGLVLVSSGLASGPAAAAAQGLPSGDGSLLSFPDPVSGSKAARTMQASTCSPLPAPQRLPRGRRTS